LNGAGLAQWYRNFIVGGRISVWRLNLSWRISSTAGLAICARADAVIEPGLNQSGNRAPGPRAASRLTVTAAKAVPPSTTQALSKSIVPPPTIRCVALLCSPQNDPCPVIFSPGRREKIVASGTACRSSIAHPGQNLHETAIGTAPLPHGTDFTQKDLHMSSSIFGIEQRC
jgi:hypothetical protein